MRASAAEAVQERRWPRSRWPWRACRAPRARQAAPEAPLTKAASAVGATERHASRRAEPRRGERSAQIRLHLRAGRRLRRSAGPRTSGLGRRQPQRSLSRALRPGAERDLHLLPRRQERRRRSRRALPCRSRRSARSRPSTPRAPSRHGRRLRRAPRSADQPREPRDDVSLRILRKQNARRRHQRRRSRAAGRVRRSNGRARRPRRELKPATTYFYRVVASNATGTTNGTIQSFTTAALEKPRVEAADGLGNHPHLDRVHGGRAPGLSGNDLQGLPVRRRSPV